jgi:hypothetical protein
MKINLFLIASDWLLWLTFPSLIVSWLIISYPIWQSFPPIGIILLGIALSLIACMTAARLIPKASSRIAYVYKAIQFSLGLILAIYRLIGG